MLYICNLSLGHIVAIAPVLKIHTGNFKRCLRAFTAMGFRNITLLGAFKYWSYTVRL